MVDPSIEPDEEGLSGEATFFAQRFKPDIIDETRSLPRIVDRPLFRRTMVNFLMKILGTIPWQYPHPLLSLIKPESVQNSCDWVRADMISFGKLCLLAKIGLSSKI